MSAGVGPRRLILIRSAGYDYAELELDEAVHLVAPNNAGKTSLIAALQFLYIDRIDRIIVKESFKRSGGNQEYGTIIEDVPLPQVVALYRCIPRIPISHLPSPVISKTGPHSVWVCSARRAASVPSPLRKPAGAAR